MNFGRVITAMVTPYTTAGEVDYVKAQKLASYLLDNGSDGLVICGTTGESPVLSKEEKIGLIAAVAEVTKGKASLIAGGCTGNCTASSIVLANEAVKAGADAVLAVVPYYNKPNQEGMYAHFKTIADRVESQIMIYNIPGRTGANLQPETLAQLAAACPNIGALKESSGSMEQLTLLADLLPENFHIYSGDDGLLLPMLALGACGVISVASHIAGRQLQELISAFQQGNNARALAIHLALHDLCKKLFLTTNPIPVKEAMNQLGWEMGDCRLPLCPPCQEIKDALQDVLQSYR